MWIVQINLLHDFLYWCLETPRANVPLFESSIESISFVVRARSRKKLLFYYLPCALSLTSGSYGLENTGGCWLCLVNWLRIVVANARVRLLEIDIYGDGFDEIEWILLVEWQTEIAFWVQFGCHDVLVNACWVVGAWPNLNRGVCHLHICCNLESVSLARKSVQHTLLAEILRVEPFRSLLQVAIFSRSRISVEVFFKLSFRIKPSRFDAELLLLLNFGTGSRKTGERTLRTQRARAKDRAFGRRFVLAGSSLEASASGSTGRKWLLLINQYSLSPSWNRTWLIVMLHHRHLASSVALGCF